MGIEDAGAYITLTDGTIVIIPFDRELYELGAQEVALCVLAQCE